jgi:MoaA/NifB/PqqE/SkfB family radical SAM enzyme
MTEEIFDKIVKAYGEEAILHITGGEPSILPWLYPYLEKNGNYCKFHLNTNAFILPPSKSVRRLKISLDSCDESYWDKLVGIKGAFQKVVNNIKTCIPHTTVSLTYTMTRENIDRIPDFIKFANKEFPGIYALFFSVYKGDNPDFIFTKKDSQIFFDEIKPQMLELLDEESKHLLLETIDEKFRTIQGVRFPENVNLNTCYLSMSELAFTPDGVGNRCSHLVRDKVKNDDSNKHDCCKYGCNRRLVAFNQEVERLLSI